MNTNEILTAIDEQIQRLQHARSLLVTVDTIPVEIPLTGRRPGRPKGSGTKQRQTSVPASKKA